MISGIVNADLAAMIRLKVHGAAAQEEVEAIVDTGFNSFLTLPPAVIARLGLAWVTQGRVRLANGAEEPVDLYEAIVDWDGRRRRIMVDAADTEPLVGMLLIRGYELNLEAVDGGSVTLRRMTP